MGTDVVKNVNKNNASHAVLFEALALVNNLPCLFAYENCSWISLSTESVQFKDLWVFPLVVNWTYPAFSKAPSPSMTIVADVSIHLVQYKGLLVFPIVAQEFSHYYLWSDCPFTGHASWCWKGDDVSVCCFAWKIYCCSGTKYSISWSGECLMDWDTVFESWLLIVLILF